MALETHDVLLRVTVDMDGCDPLDAWDWRTLLDLRPDESAAVLYVDSPDPEIHA